MYEMGHPCPQRSLHKWNIQMKSYNAKLTIFFEAKNHILTRLFDVNYFLPSQHLLV